ncbi:hypothetical protein [Merismopedia glauca]|uniref:PEP-CTERM protein-sorting domain-containing protein n=1 Tax=Merismopedia glauca CCAP 1448/3 TaxID=1296344 RepID=A0A2T1BXG2_9CYAN|nr:hypothetical protein [Merismopedia glauca]PSB00613.1 hypothetical protein C7B64_22550 [Merismopedia glauca CCAP 1448/3]
MDFNPPLADYDDIPSTYGDNVNSTSDAVGSYLKGNGFTPNITVDYRGVNPADGSSSFFDNLDFWSTDYGDLQNIAYPVVDGTLGEISLTPQTGYKVKLNSFDLAGFLRADQPNQTVRILDANYNVLLDYSPFNVEGDSGHSTFLPNLISSQTIRIQFGNSWNTGIDNINFDQVANNAVPEPATILGSLAFSIFGANSLRKRQNKKVKSQG